jgi:hypothetical protein
MLNLIKCDVARWSKYKYDILDHPSFTYYRF